MTEQRYLLIVTAEVDPEQQADWNRWYDTVHLPDALACPGVLSGRRYVSVGEVGSTERGQRNVSNTKVYTTIYEITDPDVVNTKEFQAMRGWYQFARHVRSRTQVVTAI
jgi:hypothetical protein